MADGHSRKLLRPLVCQLSCKAADLRTALSEMGREKAGCALFGNKIRRRVQACSRHVVFDAGSVWEAAAVAALHEEQSVMRAKWFEDIEYVGSPRCLQMLSPASSLTKASRFAMFDRTCLDSKLRSLRFKRLLRRRRPGFRFCSFFDQLTWYY